MTNSDKFLINCQDGANNLERTTIALVLAVTASKTNETALFLTADAAQLCVEDATQDWHAPGYEPIKDLLDTFISNGGKLWLCPACAKAKGIAQDQLVTNAEIAGAPKTMAFLVSGARLLA